MGDGRKGRGERSVMTIIKLEQYDYSDYYWYDHHCCLINSGGF